MFIKNDLKYQHYYNWNTDNPYQNELPSLQDHYIRFNGYHTLALINIFAHKHHLHNIEDCHKLEDAIGVCPTKYHLYEEIIYWLELDFSIMNNSYLMGKLSW